MTAKEAILNQISEECLEVAQRISKAIRFGLDERQGEAHGEATHATNRERIREELNDLLAALELAEELDVLPLPGLLFIDTQLGTPTRIAMEAKKRKIHKYLDYSRKLGTVTD